MIDMYNVFIVFMDTAMGLSGCTIRKKEQKESHSVLQEQSVIENRDLTHSKNTSFISFKIQNEN